MKTIRYNLLILLVCLTFDCCQHVEDPMNTVPTIETDAVREHSQNAAYLSGTISLKSECYFAYYFLISTSEDMSDARTVNVGSYNKAEESLVCHRYAQVWDLTPGTSYYVVLCATDGRSEIKGNVVSFTTIESDNSKAKVGDYYYGDGTWSSNYIKEDCIGIVFALSEEAYGNINPDLTSSNHGRIVSLKMLRDDSGYTWYGPWGEQKVYDQSLCFVDLIGDHMYGSYCLPIDGGDYYVGDGYRIPYNYYKWLEMPVGDIHKYYALCDYNGDLWTKNHAGSTGITDVYKYKTAGNRTWFVPSVGEMARLAMAYGVYKDRFVEAEKIGFDPFWDYYYWTSCARWSYDNYSTAWCYNFTTGVLIAGDIELRYCIRPIASF